jgi:hypothetical protein
MTKPKQKSPARVVVGLPRINPATFHIDKRADALLAAPGGQGNADDLLTTAQVADWFGVSAQWLETRRSKGDGPEFERLSPKVVRYRRCKCWAFLDACARRRTADYSRKSKKRGKAEGLSLNGRP